MEEFLDDKLSGVISLFFLFPLGLLLALTVHEFGHYWAARLAGARVATFSIGYGKDIKTWADRHHTRWSLKMFPFGGHVELAGKDHPGGDGIMFDDLPVANRLGVICAGPVVSMILPIFLLFPFYYFAGQPSVPPIIVGVETGDVADKAGLKPGDRVIQVEGEPVARYEQVQDYTSDTTPEPLSFVFERDDERFERTITPSVHEYISKRGMKKKTGRLGVMIRHRAFSFKALETIDGVNVDGDHALARELLIENFDREVVLGVKTADRTTRDYRVRLNGKTNEGLRDPDHENYERFYAGDRTNNFYLDHDVSGAVNATGQEVWRLWTGIFGVPFQLFPLDAEKLGPKSIVDRKDGQTRYFLFKFLYMCAMISVMMTLVNLVPFPGLDGHQIMLCISEILAGPEKTKEIAGRMTVYVLAVLYATVITINIQDVSVFSQIKLEQAAELVGGVSAR